MAEYRIIRSTITRDYLIPMADETRSKINGWTLDQIIQSWFHDYDINSYHATRDTHQVGNADRLVGVEILEAKVIGDYAL